MIVHRTTRVISKEGAESMVPDLYSEERLGYIWGVKMQLTF